LNVTFFFSPGGRLRLGLGVLSREEVLLREIELGLLGCEFSNLSAFGTGFKRPPLGVSDGPSPEFGFLDVCGLLTTGLRLGEIARTAGPDLLALETFLVIAAALVAMELTNCFSYELR
jgi:hypothetical protein